MEKNKQLIKKIFIIILIIVMCGVIFFFQTEKIGFHEDEAYTLVSSVNPDNGLMSAYDNWGEIPMWRTNDYVKDYVNLTPSNFFNLKSIYVNQAYDSHPPIFYILVHFSSIMFGGQFNKYTVFVVNIIAFVISCVVLKKILAILDKENLVIPSLILYGLSMGTISMVIYQRMYMLLTLFILLYFYLSLKLYKNNFELNKKMNIQLGIVTILGFLTQYFFAIYAFFIFAIMLVQMFRQKKDKKCIRTYVVSHITYAIIGVLLFIPCIYHLFLTDRGLKNLGNGSYFEHLLTYMKLLLYAFSINNNTPVMVAALFIFIASLIALYIKSNEKFIVLLTTIPTICYFFITVKMTSFQELRYIMPIIPFIVIIFFFILDKFINIKFKNIIFISIAMVSVVIGIAYSKPKFLYRNYQDAINIANENSEKSFVYVYDNMFNHMQSIPEMLIYEKSLIINYNKNELEYVTNDEILKNEGKFILSIKSYMDNEKIIEEIKDNSNFKNVTLLYKCERDSSSDFVNNNYYLVSK